MIEQVANGQWMLGGVRTLLSGLHFLPLEFRNVFLHQVVELKMPFVDHHHDTDCDERLGNRGGPKHVGGLQRFLVLDAPTHRINGRDLSIAGHQSDHARALPAIDDYLQVLGNLRQRLLVQTMIRRDRKRSGEKNEENLSRTLEENSKTHDGELFHSVD